MFGKKNTLLDEVKAAQKKVKEAEAQCAGIAAKLAELEDAKSAAHIAEAEIPALLEKKGDIQAALALGTGGSKAELDQIVKQISQAQATVETHTQTVAGLTRSLDAAKSDLEQVKHPAHILVSAFIRSEADRVQASYLEDAKNLLTKFRQLQALAVLAGQNDRGDVFATGGEFQSLSIPVFQLEASGQWPYHGSTWPKWDPCTDLTQGNRDYIYSDIDSEKARLEGLGIVL